MNPIDPPEWFTKRGEQLHTEVNTIIRDAINNQPRSLQKRIGPSELGKPCDRWILHKLAGDQEPPRAQVAWKPAIGTAVHAHLETMFNNANPNHRTEWLTEHQVTVGYLPDGTPITGHSDLFHVPTGTVIDFKIVGNRQLAHYRTNGPSEQYRRQAHCYGGGFMLEDQAAWGKPTRVAILFLPRERDYEDHYWWAEPWQPAIWTETINRVNRLWNEWATHGMPAAAETKPICDDVWCHWCRQLKRETANSQRKNLFDDFPPF